MHASILTTDFANARPAPTPQAEAFGKGLLLVNGIMLGAVALTQSIFDLAGHFLNAGPLAAALYRNPDAIAYFEAHGLALLIAVLLLIHRKASGATWNRVAALTHLLLGSANLVFWASFASYGLETMGVVATAMHVLFFGFQTITALARSPAAGRA